MVLLATLLPPGIASGDPGQRLLATGGLSTIEGAAGGGLVPMAVISGYGSSGESGLAALATHARTSDYRLSVAGVSFAWHNRLELSFARQRLDLTTLGPKLGMPDAALRQNVFGAKLRVIGDLLYTSWPQLSVGVQYKHNLDFDIPRIAGAKDDSGLDLYVSASKVYLAGLFNRNVLLSGTLRATQANQTGLLGFGGDANNEYRVQFEGLAGIFLNRHWIIGTEYRQKPDNLSFAAEDDWKDVFVAWFPNKYIALTGAWLDLGDIATLPDQTGWYLSLQLTL